MSPEAVLENIRVGLDALRIHPARTTLSVLGITIGCAALVATLSVSDGLMRFARAKVAEQTSVQLVGLSPRTSALVDGTWRPVHGYPRFGIGDAEELREHCGIATSVTLLLGSRVRVRHRGVDVPASATFSTASLPDFVRLDLGAGRFLSPMETQRGSPVVVLDHALARVLADGRDPYALVGREVRVNEHRRTVIGVLEPGEFEDPEGTSFALYAPLEAAGRLLPTPEGGRFAPSIQLLAPGVEHVDALRERVEDWAARRDRRWREHMQVVVGLSQLQQVELGFLMLKLFVGALVGISLLVGGVGIMNVLLASVAERTREIGIRKSVGARRADVRMQFLAESVAIALVGALVGLATGWLIGWATTAVFRAVAHVPIAPVLTWGSVALAVGASTLVGLVFGTWPARRAAELPPIVALMQE